MKNGFPLLKPGTFRDRHNKVYTITKRDIEGIASTYGNSGKAPLTVGHPDSQRVPAFGVVDALKVVGDTLYFKPARMVAEFAKLVDGKFFPGVSAGLMQRQGGGYDLGHVAFLSAQKPAVPLEGLPLVEFSAPEGDVVSVDVTDAARDLVDGRLEFASAAENWLSYQLRQLSRMFRQLKNKAIETDGAEVADTLYPEYVIEELAAGLPEETTAEPVAQFSSHPEGGRVNFEELYNQEKAKVAALEAEKVELSASVESLKSEVAGMHAAARKAEFSAFVDTLIAQGRVLPDQKESEEKTLEALHQASQAIEFSAPDGKKSPIEQYKESLSARPVVAPGGNEILGPEFAASTGAAQDPYAEEGAKVAASLRR